MILRKESYVPDDALLLILKTSMCLNAIRYLFQATVIRPKDFDELDGLAASISFPVEYDDEAIGEALGDQDLMAYVVGELHDLVVRMRPEWLDNEDTSLTIKAFLDDAECQTFKGLVAMKEGSYTFNLEG